MTFVQVLQLLTQGNCWCYVSVGVFEPEDAELKSLFQLSVRKFASERKNFSVDFAAIESVRDEPSKTLSNGQFFPV